ncbi:MAG: hypothetical protein IJA30_07500 [Bacilli bacterium]|nr:hypothetical protein [Bacilli bacterium]MBQ3512122.1 hypothetical protein [Bacilli bacterium]
MNSIQMLSMVNNFPIGSTPKDRAELLSKAEIVSYLSRFQDQFSTIENVDERELMVRTFLGEVLALEEGENLPTLAQAESTLKLSPGFVQDFGKVEYVRETNPDFNATYDAIATNLGLINEAPRKSR